MSGRSVRLLRAGTLLCVSLGVLSAQVVCTNNSPSTNQVTCTGGAGASVDDQDDGAEPVSGPSGPLGPISYPHTVAGSPFPTSITISNAPAGATVSNVTVTIHSYTSVGGSSTDGSGTQASGSLGVGLLLTGPKSGGGTTNLELLRCVGGLNADMTFAAQNGSFTLANTGTTIPDGNFCYGSNFFAQTFIGPSGAWNPSGGTYAIVDYGSTWSPETEPNYNEVSVPGIGSNVTDYATPGSGLNVPEPVGGSTTPSNETPANTSIPSKTFSVFTGAAVNGQTWNLYLVDDTIAYENISFASWDITITYTAATTPSTTSLSASPTPVFATSPTNSLTLTATVTSGATGTVTFQEGATNLACSQGNPVTVSSNIAQCTISYSSNSSAGLHSYTASYSGDSTYEPSSGSANVFVYEHVTPTGTTYCNTDGISVTGNNPTAPYPSVIYVTGISNSVETVSVTLNTLSSNNTDEMQMALVSPDGTGFEFWGFVGVGAPTSTGNYTIQDGSSLMPSAFGSTALSPGTYGPSVYSSVDNFLPNLALPAPQIPGTFGYAATQGSATFESTFTGKTADGPWSLFLVNDVGSIYNTSIASWCIDITPASGSATSITLTSSPTTYAIKGNQATFTATVTSSGSPVTEGTVTFTENGSAVAGTVAGNNVVNVNGSGVATFSTSSLPEGDHTITASYTDSMGTFNDQIQTESMRVDAASTNPSLGVYCNASGVTVPGGAGSNDIGAATPNPSNIFVTNLPGTVKTASVTFNNFSTLVPGNLETLLVGPNGGSAPGTAQTLDFFSPITSSDASFIQAISNETITFADSGSAIPGSLSSNFSVPTTVGPTSNGATSYTASMFYTLPGTVQRATSQGAFTFNTGSYNGSSGGVYLDTNPNGTWSLYFDQNTHDEAAASPSINSWCMNFTENPPALTATQSGPASAIQGGTGSVTLVVHNPSGPGSAGGALPVTVSNTFPSGLTPTGGNGTNWTCGTPSGQAISCSSTEFIASGSDFATLSINFSVAPNATPGNVSNTAVVSGSGMTSSVNSNSVTIDILTAPVLAVSKTHTGTFTQGQTAEWDITVSNTAASGSTGGTTTVSDTLPTGYSLNNFSGTGWSCSSIANAVTCTSTQAVAGGSSFPTLKLIVNVPANSPASVANTASAYGGGDLTHTNPGTAATSNIDSVSVTQVAASVVATSGSGQSANLSTPFSNPLVVTVKDAAGVVISGTSVTFNAPGAGASGTFSNSSTTITGTTNGSGQLSESFAANGTAGGPYTVTATSNSITTSPGFSLTNTVNVIAPPTISISFGAAAVGLGGATSLNYAIQNPNPGSALTGVSFTDVLPAGLAVANTPGVTNTCGGTFTSVAGSASTSLTGAMLAANSSCAISVNVQATSIGTKNNTSGPISANESGPGNPSNTASLDVVQVPTVSVAFGAPSIPLNGTTSLTFTITNPSATTNFFNIGLTDTLPGGLVVASPNGMLGTCLTLDGALVIADPGSASISVTSVNLLPFSSCAVTVNVTGTSAGSKSDSTGNIGATFSDGGPVEVGGPGGSAGIAVIAPPSISAAFSPGSIAAGGTSSLTLTITNPALNTVALSGVSCTDFLPAGLTVSSSTLSVCGGTVTTNPGTGIVLSNGSLGVNSQCQFSVSVTGSANGDYTDTTGAVISSDGGTGNTASANLSVETLPAPPPPGSGNPVVSPTSLSFTYSIGRTGVPLAQSIAVSVSNGTILAVSVAPGAAWLSAAAAGNGATVTINAMGLAPGTYQGVVLLSIYSEPGPVSVPVTLTVMGAPVLVVSAPSLSFTAVASPGTVPPSQIKSVLLTAQNSNVAFTVSSSAPWLSVGSNSSNTPSTLSMTVNPNSLAPGTYNGSVQIAAPGASNSPLTIGVTLNVVSPLAIASGAFQNAASFLAVPGAANTIMAIYGSLGCSTAPTVLVNNSAAELIGHTAGMVTFTLPAAVDGESSAAIAVVCNGQQTQPIEVPLAAVSPGIFTLSMNGSGQGAIVNQDGSVNGASHPASLNSYVSVYGTGFGAYLAPSADGLQQMSHTVQAFIGGEGGGVPAQVQFAGHAPDETLGLQQINVLIPSAAPTGASVPIQLVVDGKSTQSGVTLAIQ